MRIVQHLSVLCILFLVTAGSAAAATYPVASDLSIRAVINTVEKGDIDAIWEKGGEETTAAGDRVIWGYFYASPNDVTWGSQQNPDLYVKIWYDRGGRIDVNFFHVSVPDIDVYSTYTGNGTSDQSSTATMDNRYYRHEYNSTTSTPADYSGSRTGSWISVDKSSGAVYMTMTQSGSSFTGTMNVMDTDCGDVYGASCSGTISGSSFTMTASYYCDGDSVQLSITSGTISGNTFSGSYTLYVNGYYYDSGTFSIQ